MLAQIVDPALTDQQITAAMARAEMVACRGERRCFAMPHILSDALASCTPKGRCTVGWIVANSGRDSWAVWLDIHTGEGRLRPRTE